MMDNDARVSMFVVELFVSLVFAMRREQFLASLILNVLDLLKFVTRLLDHSVELVLKVFVDLKSSMLNVKEILFKHLQLQNHPQLDVIKQSLNSHVHIFARCVLTREFLPMMQHTHTIVKL
jgi:hypothetical protein